MLTLLFSSTAILFAGLILSLYVYSTRNFNYWKKKKVFFIKPWPIFGNFLSVFLGQKSVSDWSWELYKSARADYFGVFIFDQPHLILKSPEMVKNVLIKDFSYFQDRQVYINPDDDILKHALFFSKNPEWKIMRSKVSPIYTSGKLKMMFPLILNESQAMVGFLENKGSLESLEIKDICSKYSTNVIAKCAFSVDAGCFERENAHFRMISKRLFDFRMTTAIRQLSAFFLPGLVKLFKLRFFEKSVVDEMKNIFSTVLDERNKMSTLKGNDLADMLLEIRKKKSKEEFSDNMLLAQAVQFFIAGFETVSNTVAFALYELALSNDIQETLRSEIMDIIKEHNGNVTYEAINQMKYLDMVVCETLRKYPLLPFLDRRCNTDYKVPGTDLIIEKGIPVLLPIIGFHYDEKYFPDPMKFDPKRFSDKSLINRDGIYYFPFGEGPRVCIGERFGLLGVKTALISVISNFKIEKCKDTPCPIIFEPNSFVLQSTVGIPVKIVVLKR